MLRLIRRHRKDCPHTSTRYRRCKCPIHVYGTLGGEKVRRAMDQTSWEAASDLVNAWTASGQIGVVKADVPTVKEAVAKFLEDLEHGQKRRAATIGKHRNVLEKRLIPWAEKHGYRLLKQLGTTELRDFRATWPDGALTAQKNLERLRAFFYFCQTAGWVKSNPAVAVKSPRPEKPSERVKVFKPEEIEKIIEACDRYPTQNSFGHHNPSRVKAFVLTLRYSGLRIGDVVGLKREHFDGEKLFLRTQKSGESVYLPLPKVVTDALSELKNGGEYFFWTGNGLRKSAVADWQRSLRRVFKEAKVDGNAHMFRHSLATELLSKGVTIENVAAILGHATPMITAKYYSHWVKARRESLESSVKQIWDQAAVAKA